MKQHPLITHQPPDESTHFPSRLIVLTALMVAVTLNATTVLSNSTNRQDSSIAFSTVSETGTLPSESTPLNIQVSHDGEVMGASHLVTDFSEVMLAIDPTNPLHLLGTSKFFFDLAAYKHYTGVFETYDSGYTWDQLQPDGLEVYTKTSDPVTTFDELGNSYFTLLTIGPLGLDMLKKPVDGAWEAPVTVDRTTNADKQWIIGDQDPRGDSPYAGNLYISWADVTINNQENAHIMFSRSADRNLTWSPPITLTTGFVEGSMLGVALDGTVYVTNGAIDTRKNNWG